MPILPQHPVEAISEKDFHELDYKVMGLAYAIHNEFGRLCDETIYHAELLKRCLSAGLQVESEFEVKLTYMDYIKPLFIDLLIENSVYELKSIRTLYEPQRIQTLNYLFATNTRHGKLINFRPASIEHEFVSTRLNHNSRRSFTIEDSKWRPNSDSAHNLKQQMLNLLNDWGAFLSSSIYEDALIHFLGGSDQISQTIDIGHGNQKLNVLSPSDFFLVTAVRNNVRPYRVHLEKLLRKTPFTYLHWINLAHSRVSFSTLEH